MSRRLSLAAVVAGVVALAAPLISPDVVVATTVDAQRAEVQRVVDELDRLHEQADVLAEEYNSALDRERELNDEIVDAEARVAAKETELVTLQGDLAEVAVRAYTGSGTDVLGPLFSNADAYTDGLREDQYSRAALDAGTATSDDLDELISDITKERKQLESLRNEVQQLQETIQQKQERTEQLTQEYSAYETQARAKLGDLIEQEEQRRAEAAWRKLQDELAAAQAAAASSSSGGGGGGNAGTPAAGGGGNGGGTATSAAPPPATNIPSVSGQAGVAISAAQGQLGVAYKYATSNPGVSFDCSGLTHYAWGQAGVFLPRNSASQAASVPRIPAGAAQPGDLIFYYSPISHVGIYLGGSSYIHAPATGDVVKISGVNWNKVTAVGRPG